MEYYYARTFNKLEMHSHGRSQGEADKGKCLCLDRMHPRISNDMTRKKFFSYKFEDNFAQNFQKYYRKVILLPNFAENRRHLRSSCPKISRFFFNKFFQKSKTIAPNSPKISRKSIFFLPILCSKSRTFTFKFSENSELSVHSVIETLKTVVDLSCHIFDCVVILRNK